MAKAAGYGLGFACFALVAAMASATQFQVGGNNGWSVAGASAQSYNTWAMKNRFKIGDTLVFVYPKDTDSVLVVQPADYNACNTSSYDKKFADGNTVFTLDRAGAFFFISGVDANCRANEKLIVMVLAGRNGNSSGGAPPSSPAAPPPASSTSTPPPAASPAPSASSPPPATGCDASVLLNDTANFTGEQTAFPNRNSIRGLDVIDNVKAQVEAVCAQTVSCADILTVAARDSIVALGGPSYTVPLGRRDSTTASLSEANRDLPPPTSDLADLVGNFSRKGLSVTDMVALSGAHTIGQAACINFRSRIYGESNIDPAYAASLQANCPQSAPNGDGTLAPLDVSTPDAFDNAYYGNLLSQQGLLHSDQQLFNGGSTDALVNTYASNAAQFSADFAAAMVNMGNIGVITGAQGEIRLNCAAVN